MNPELNLTTVRARKARVSALINKTGERVLEVVTSLFGISGIYLLVDGSTRRFGYWLLAISLLCGMLLLWDRGDLKISTSEKKPQSLDGIVELGLLGQFKKSVTITPRVAWEWACTQWQARFLLNHLLLDADMIKELLGDQAADMPAIWQSSLELLQKNEQPQLNAGTLAAAILVNSTEASAYLAKLNLQTKDVLEVYGWLERLNSFMQLPGPHFGGIGRDWAAGFTPTLDRFGQNLSHLVEGGVGHFYTLAHGDILDGVIHNLSQTSGAVALVGNVGTGKSSFAYALAQRLLEGRDEALRYYQIVSLNASMILSSGGNQLEEIILTLFGEASNAGNIIIFLDDARLFFGQGTGAFDMGQVLMPLVQNRQIEIIVAFTPDDFQRLKASNQALADSFSLITVPEPSPEVTMDILEDSALSLESREAALVSFQAVREAYRLSGEYMSDQSYPGKAISLLEQSIPYAEGKVLTAKSVQTATEQSRGVKVSKAEAPEADVLLHLEDRIHERMVNQERAVSVVASALRRGRAGVADPKRPVGSFLFLGPTGVGKTELARSLAASYFGDEKQMIRLDMSEYQRPEDVSRLLASGSDDSESLILAIREQPFSVVLLDEVEKAHPNILNLMLQLLDEGQLTDQSGRAASFRSSIIITTSNAGAVEISQRVAAGDSLADFERPLIDKLISAGQFKPELINRFNEVVLFRPLNIEELTKVGQLMLGEVNKILAKQNVSVKVTDAALVELVKAGYDPQYGARPMRRVIEKTVEDAVAQRILRGEAQPGSIITLDIKDLSLPH
jgi:ATP-dependent Clp protease ATP-binding subunit ClpC